MPGRPIGYRPALKAMAIASQRWYEKFSAPLAVKVHAGAPVIEHRHGRRRLCRDGQGRRWTLLGESVWHRQDANGRRVVDGRRKYGMQRPRIHTGGPLDPRIGG